MPLRFSKASLCSTLVWLAVLWPAFHGCAGAQTALEELKIQDAALPKAFLRQPYGGKFAARGGVPPFQWTLTGGNLPNGLTLNESGTISGRPLEKGEFHFVVNVSDSAHPPVQRSREFTLLVVAPLLIEWSRPPQVAGQRIEGAVKVSNGTEQDFDLTVIIVAVNENGLATALGYQRFTLQKDLADKEIAFGQSLPPGAYEVNADAVAEVASTNSIYRSRVVSQNLQVQPIQ